jgi:hypothetical protein
VEILSTAFSRFILSTLLLTANFAGAQANPTNPTNPSTGTGTQTTLHLTSPGSVSGYSYYDPGTAATGTVSGTNPTIYGGTTGPTTGSDCQAPASNDQTCNSCAGNGLTVCNQNSIHQNLNLSMTLVTATANLFNATSPRVKYKLSTNTTTLYDVSNYATLNPSLAAGQSFTAQIKWGDLCANAGGGADCSGFAAGTKLTMNVGIETNGSGALAESVNFDVVIRYVDPTAASTVTACPTGATSAGSGVCDYTMDRGDEKVYLADIAADPSLTVSGSSVLYNKIVLFYTKDLDAATFSTTVNNKSESVTLGITPANGTTTAATLAENRIMNLENGHKYCFALANVDQTGIISLFPNTADLAANEAKYCATPDQVVGLLDDKKCFIATATFGSVMAPEVVTFRKFRNEYLLTNSVGRAFVKEYYKYGPIPAKWIREHDSLKTLSLAMLWPLLLFVKLSLALGVIPALLIVLITGVVLVKAWSQIRRTRESAV